jgi:hypothetical protein
MGRLPTEKTKNTKDSRIIKENKTKEKRKKTK